MIKVILQSDVADLGTVGEVLKVRPGYARNYLFPKKLAIPASSQSLKERKHKDKLTELKIKKASAARAETAQKLKDHSLSFYKPTSPQGKLFGSISAFEIAKALREDGFAIDKRFVLIESPIKAIGEYKIPIDFSKDIKAEIQVSVLNEKDKKA